MRQVAKTIDLTEAIGNMRSRRLGIRVDKPHILDGHAEVSIRISNDYIFTIRISPRAPTHRIKRAHKHFRISEKLDSLTEIVQRTPYM
jgi:hypothetical protein